MSEEKWEYCRVWLTGADKTKKGKNDNCGITFISASGDLIPQELTNDKEAFKFNAFLKVMGILGGNGWELVSLQHGNDMNSWWPINWQNGAAYYKRRVLPGRAVNEPKITL